MSRKKIAVLMASIDREYQQDFASGLASAGSKYGIDICIFNSQGHMNVAISTSDAEESMIYDLPDLNDFDGIISMPATLSSDEATKKIYRIIDSVRGKPHISIDIPQKDAVTIQFNDRISVEEMTEHLITEHGARSFAFVSGPLNSDVATGRIEACKNVLERHGLSLENNMIFDGQWTRVGGRNAIESLLNRGGTLPDAIICGNDDMALSVIECLNEHSIRVPNDIAVTGFDALREAVMRGLTTICRPIDRSARHAIEILNKWIEGKEPEEKTIILPTIPIYGDSCGCTQNLEHVNEKLRALGSERWDMETSLARLSMFSSMMAGVGDEQDAHQKIHSFVENWDIHEFFVCVDSSICRETEEISDGKSYPDKMLLLYGYRNGKEYECKHFPTFDLVPLLNEIRKNTTCLVFCPLYYRERSFGYVAMNLGSGTGTTLYSVLMLLNGALMSLFLQTNLKRSANTIERMAVHDIMTGMLNRRGYMKKAPVELEAAKQKGKVFALLSADMDHMKDINDQYGHLMGDEAICRMGRALEGLSCYGITPVHISGDEFLAYGIVKNYNEAEKLIQYVNDALIKINREEPWICDISASLGVFAAVPKEGETLDMFMTNADRAMYADKNKRKYGRRKEDIKKDPS